MIVYVQFLRDGLVYIPGESKAAGHEGWIEALSVSFGQPPSQKDPAPGPEADSSKKSNGDVIITKAVDSASPRLAMASHDGTDMTVTIDFNAPGNKAPGALPLKFNAIGAMITQVGLSGGTRPMESVTINYEKLTLDSEGNGPDVSDHVPTQYLSDPGRAP